VTAAALIAGLLLALPPSAGADSIGMNPDPAIIDTSGNTNLSGLGTPYFEAQALNTESIIYTFLITDAGTADLSPCSVADQCFLHAEFNEPVTFALGWAIVAPTGPGMTGAVSLDYDTTPPSFLQARFGIGAPLPTLGSFYIGRHGMPFVEGMGVEKVDVSFAVVPEPSSLALLAAACGLLAALPRRSARLP
jgi:hypothetical protein